MALRIVKADDRLAEANAKTTMVIFGAPGVGKTSLLRSLLASATLCVDLEAGLKSVQDWQGDSIPIRSWPDAVDIACLIGGVDPSADPSAFFSAGHYEHVAGTYPNLAQLIAPKRIIFVDSITELTRQCMAWAKTRPEAVSEKIGKPDVRGAYGLLAREVIALLKHLQHAPGKTVIFVGVLERVVDEFNREHWQPQMEGGKRTFRAMIDSALGLDPDDNSEEAKAKRRLRGLADLDGISFVAKIAVEPNNDPRYPDQNKLDRPVLPNEKEWQAVMNGEEVAPSPSRPRSGGSAPRNAPAAAKPAWGQQPAAAAQQAAVAAWQRPATAASGQDAGGIQPAKPAGPAWLNQ